MFKQAVLLVVGALALIAAAPAFADPPHDRGRSGHYDRDWRDDRWRDDHRDRYDRDDRWDRDHDRWDDRGRDWRGRDWRDDWRGPPRSFGNFPPPPPPYWRGPPPPPHWRGPPPRWDNDWRFDDRRWNDRNWDGPRWRPGYYVPDYGRYPRINDYYGYRGHRLPPPGRGQYYVDVDGDILLIAAATGLIVWALSQ